MEGAADRFKDTVGHGISNLLFDMEWNAEATVDPAHMDIHRGHQDPSQISIGMTNASQNRPSPSPSNDNLHVSLDHAFGQLNQPVIDPDALRELTRRRPPTPAPQSAVRFSRASIKILKTWLSAHQDKPYPRVDDVESFQRQTGLSKQQILTWFANARRPSRSGSARRSSTRSPLPVPSPARTPRRGNGSDHGEQLDPLQRWTNSPPDQEPAAAAAIARAVAEASMPIDPSMTLPASQANSSYNASSASSAAASDSASLSSAYSHASGGSLQSLEPRRKVSKRRRRSTKWHAEQRRQNKNQPATGRIHDVLRHPADPFQCTFCTQTFKSKHNWQRHEKSFHLSLERWECSPNGPTFVNDHGESTCVFCGERNVGDEHLRSHSYDICRIRTREERAFYRKDHLRQHLKLVHRCQFQPTLMEGWRSEVMQVRSRCGFCGISISSWLDRVDHLADHFKSGSTMADWEGDWGFEPHVLEMVENSIAPCESRSRNRILMAAVS